MSDTSEENGDPRGGFGEMLTPARLLGFAAAVVLSLVLLPQTDPSQQDAHGLTAQFALRGQMEAVEETVVETTDATEANPLSIGLDWSGSEAARTRLVAQLRASRLLKVDASADTRLHVTIRETDRRRVAQVTATLKMPDGKTHPVFEVDRRSGGWEAILPPLAAVLIALFFHRIIFALGAAVWLGAALQTGLNPLAATWMFLSEYLWINVTDSFNLYIIGFTLTLVGMVHVIIRMGGIAGVLDAVSWLASSVRSTRVSCTLMGFVLFFDDYANTVVVGSTMRPLTDEKKISREKLAYLVDSTSAPVAGLAIISTWIGYEVGLFQELSDQIQLGMQGYEIFFNILPLRFYCLFALLFVLMVAISGRDFGPMLRAERRARHLGQVRRPDSRPLRDEGGAETEAKEDIPHRWYNAFIPVTLVIVGTILGLYWSGWRGGGAVESIPGVGQLLGGEASLPQLWAAWGHALGDMLSADAWKEALKNAANAKVLFWASVAGSVTAVGLGVGQGLLQTHEALRSWGKALPMMWFAIAILVLAWSIQSVCDDVGTSIYLVGTVQHLVAPRVLPLLVFGLAAVVAFATGTSWGTMGILLPAMIPLAYHMTVEVAYGSVLLLMCFGAVLDGAIFGDHCSPISDTTVMSSIASGVDHVDHVRTQIPYAFTAMSVSAVFGYGGVAMGVPVWAAYPLGAASLAIALYLFGESPEAPGAFADA